MNCLSFLKIIRVHIVAGGALAFSLGALLAITEGGSFKILPLILGYIVVLLGDLSTHYSNDYFDIEVDKISEQKNFFSGNKILVTQPQLRSLAKSVSVTFLVLSDIIAAVSVLFFNVPPELLIITFVANLIGWFYSAPPLRLSSRCLGEIVIALATGFIIPCIGYIIVRGHFDSLFLSFSIPFMMYGFMLSLNLSAPDIEIDKKGEKRTFSVLTGGRNIFFVILAVAFLATITFFGLTFQLATSVINMNAIFLLSFIPMTAGIVGFIISFKKRDLNRFSTLNISSLFILNITIIAYLATLRL